MTIDIYDEPKKKIFSAYDTSFVSGDSPVLTITDQVICIIKLALMEQIMEVQSIYLRQIQIRCGD